VRVLYLGDAIGQSPFPYMVSEPLLDASGVLACKMWYPYDTIRKSMRVYMPRTLRALNHSYDVIILSDANVASFEARHLNWFSSAVTELGLGLAMVGGFESFGGHGYSSWGDTSVGKILPVECPPEYNAEGRIEILVPTNPVVSNLPWDTIGTSNYFGGNVVVPKMASEVVANMRSDLLPRRILPGAGRRYPLLIWWNIGRGRSFAMAADWTPAAGTAFMRWTYYGDFCINLVLFTAGQPVPEDIEQVHLVRRILKDCMETSRYLYSMIDFVEKFGASTTSVQKTAAKARGLVKQARQRYLSYEFEESHDLALQALSTLQKGLDEALAARDRALFWVYLIEYLVVTATCLIAGTILYSLMIRRRLYRQVKETRPSTRRRSFK